MAAAQPLVCLVTHPPAGAEAFARLLVDRRLAACVNRLPVASTYRWQGSVEEDAEELLVIKSARHLLPALERALRDHHPYDVPELIVLAPDAVGDAYARWWLGSLAGSPDPVEPPPGAPEG